MTKELFHDYLAQETEWFLGNAAKAEKLPEPRLTVKYLLEIAQTKGLNFRMTVLLASAWIADNGKRAPKKKVGLFYVRWFKGQTAPPPAQFKPGPVAAPQTLTSWVKGLPGGN